MDWPVLALVVVLAGLLVAAAALAELRRRALAGVRDALGAPPTSDDLPMHARHLVERVAAAEAAVVDLRREATAFASLAGLGVVHVGAALIVESANPTAHAMLGRPPGTMVGRSAIEAFVDRRLEEIVASARDLGGANGEVTVGGPDGPTVAVRARRRADGGVQVVLEDVSELRRLQQIRAEFIDNLSHELRTPLSTISLLAETLAREAEAAAPPVPPRLRDRIEKIEVETGHIVQMVNELLDLARIESGAAIVRLDDVELGSVAAASVERLRLFADRQGVRLHVDVDADGRTRVRGDDDRLGQVFVNLVHNAVKFSPAGGDVTVRVRRDADTVIASVEDEGIGIPAAARDRIFERFYKLDRARARGGGTGLGLAIARHIVEQHGGRIRVESDEGRGSTFTFALPAAERSAET